VNALDWLPVLTLGALLGAVGQVIRSIPGLNKLRGDPNGKFEPMQLMMSVIIGAAAGVIAMITLELTSETTIAAQDIITVIAAGYTGADFIEAFITKRMSSGPALPQQQPTPVAIVSGASTSTIATPSTLIGTTPVTGSIPATDSIAPATNAVG
jgi:hypothetical protein